MDTSVGLENKKCFDWKKKLLNSMKCYRFAHWLSTVKLIEILLQFVCNTDVTIRQWHSFSLRLAEVIWESGLWLIRDLQVVWVIKNELLFFFIIAMQRITMYYNAPQRITMHRNASFRLRVFCSNHQWLAFVECRLKKETKLTNISLCNFWYTFLIFFLWIFFFSHLIYCFKLVSSF